MPSTKIRITDKMRLDWLQNNSAILDASCANSRDPFVRAQTDYVDGWGAKVRTAIDAAIIGERKRTGKK